MLSSALNYSRITVGLAKIKAFDSKLAIPETIPPYTPPEKMGDELGDDIAELQAYREYESKWREVRTYKQMLEELRQFHSIDIEEELSNQLKNK